MNRNHKRDLQIEKLYFSTAVDQGNRFVLRYEPDSDTAYTVGHIQEYFNNSILKNFESSLLGENYIAKESINTFTQFMHDMKQQVQKTSCNICINSRPEKAFTWIHIDSTLIKIPNQKPCYIISFYDCNDIREKELAYSKLQKDRQASSQDSIVYFEVNLSQDKIVLVSSNATKSFDKW